MKHRNHTLHAFIAAALLAGAPLAFAHSAPQQTPPSNTGSEPMMHQQDQSNSQMQNRENNMQNQRMQHNNMHSHSKMMGWHSMPGKVTSVNHQTGIVKVKTEGKNLRVHFPPKTITNLKSGDKITLNLGYKMKSSSDNNMGGM